MRFFMLAATLAASMGGGAAAALAAPAAPLLDPPVFASQNGLLDVMIVAEPKPVTALGLTAPAPTGWVYTICPRPTSASACPTGGKTSSAYGGFRLALQPGDELKIRFVNRLPKVDPAALSRIHDDPLLALNPSNLHTHGLIVTAAPNSVAPPAIPVYGDFVFTSVFNPANGDPAKIDKTTYDALHAHGDVVSNGVVDYDIRVPANHPPGAFWIHPHMHGIALNQLGAGMSGIISIGSAAAYACADEACRWPIPESRVRHLVIKDMQVLADHSLNVQPDPGFCTEGAAPLNGVCNGDPAAGFAGGQWFFTLNGQKYPSIPLSSPEGEIWRFTNASGAASYDMQLVENKTKRAMAFQVISIDGVSVSYPTGATAGQVVTIGGNRMKIANCGSSAAVDRNSRYNRWMRQSYRSAPVCATELILMPAARAEVHVAWRDANNALTAAPVGATATLMSKGITTGPAGDPWPAVNFASVSFAPGLPWLLTEAVHIVAADAASTTGPGGIFQAAVPGATRARLPAGCAPLAPGHRRRIYFGNPNVPGGAGAGQDKDGNAIFGLGYEEIDQNGKPVPGTFQDVSRFDPSRQICLPLAAGQKPATETWELYNLTTELHNFHIHQTKFRKIDPTALDAGNPMSPSAQQPGIAEDTAPLPYAVAGAGSQPATNSDAAACTVADFKAGRCQVTPIVVQIPFAKLGSFVYHCHILEHEDGGMMSAIRVVPSPI